MNQKPGLVRYLLYFCVQIGEGEFQFKLLNFVNHTAKYGPLNWPIIVHGLTKRCNEHNSCTISNV